MMSKAIDYKAAYERQTLARKKAEIVLEIRARELYESNQSLIQAYNQLKYQSSQLHHQEKLASIGQLAAGVAHEINNPVGFLKSNLGTLVNYVNDIKALIKVYERTLAALYAYVPCHSGKAIAKPLYALKARIDLEFIQQDIDDLISESLEGAMRLEGIVRNLKSFARKNDNHKTLFCINECIEDTLKLVWNEIRYKCRLVKALAPVPQILGCPSELNQVILNLLVNASQSIDGHGEITVTTTADASHVYLIVKDTGSGIPKAHLQKIFDPFFTTKDIDSGTGLGLSITHGIITSMGGTIAVESEEGTGSQFTLTFPIG